jgi:hypothetical protein
LPKILGIAILVGSLGYLLEGLVKVTFIDNGAVGAAVGVLLVIATVSELAFAFWLLIKGLDVTAWNGAVGSPAANAAIPVGQGR